MDIIVGDEPQLRSWIWGPVLNYCQKGKTLPLSDAFNPFGMRELEGTSFLFAEAGQTEKLLRAGHNGVFLLSNHSIREIFNLSITPPSLSRDEGRIGITGVTLLAPVNAGNRLAGLRNTMKDWLRFQN